MRPLEQISGKILLIHGEKVMLDRDLAELYGVETKSLKEQCIEILKDSPLRYHFGTLKKGEHAKYLSFAFNEQGVAMLSSVLRSKNAIMREESQNT